jgi:dipeptidase D
MVMFRNKENNSKQAEKDEIEPGVASVFTYFKDISQIPRAGGNETKVREYLKNIALENKFQYEVDQIGNILIEVPPTKGFEEKPGVVLQAHMDMICEGEPNPAKFGVKIIEKDGWLMANGTSLGADNGIGLSIALSIATSKISHGQIALMFTVGEDIGLVGAKALSFNNKLEKYQYLLNLDAEDDGVAEISSAGGGQTVVSLPINKNVPAKKPLFSITLDHLGGGHSGLEIDKKRLNAIKTLASILNNIFSKTNDVDLIDFQSGKHDNAIPNQAMAIISTESDNSEYIKKILAKAKEKIRKEIVDADDQNFRIIFKPAKTERPKIINQGDSLKMLGLISILPNGIIKWSDSVKGLVETSTNLGIIKIINNEVQMIFLSRSSINADLEHTKLKIGKIAKKYGAGVKQEESYSGWPAKPNSEIIKITKSVYQKMTNKELKISVKHAGLECGVLLKKYPHLEAISLGAEIKDAHSIKERVNIDSTIKLYHLVKSVIKEVSNN